MAQPDSPVPEEAAPETNKQRWSITSFAGLKKLAAPWRDNASGELPVDSADKQQSPCQTQFPADKSSRRRFVPFVPRLNRVKTLERQNSELRDRLKPVTPSHDERRAISADRRTAASRNRKASCSQGHGPRSSAPDFHSVYDDEMLPPVPPLPSSLPNTPLDEKQYLVSMDEALLPTDQDNQPDVVDVPVLDIPADVEEPEDAEEAAEPLYDEYHDDQYIDDKYGDIHSMTTSTYDEIIHQELETKWILNLSMHFRDRSKREKFFVTYRQTNPDSGITAWHRVTISLDYRDAPENSLERDLLATKYQREKSAKIYEAIRESLGDIQFYPTVTNLKLQTTDGRLHVHVVEDVNEIIQYPSKRMVHHLGCRRIRERDIEFDSHMSGFVYRVRVDGQILIKKEIPGPDTVDEFLYEVNALNSLRHSQNVIQFHGVVVDDQDDQVKGLLISYAEQGALIDIIYDNDHQLSWDRREKWARQIVQGLSEIHESGFVQGDFTLSNIVVDHNDNAKIIDINRRGCPVGWEPPEATPLIESNQRISMYIGVKSDLFQLGMVLWALATQEDEPEQQGRPLQLSTSDHVPQWYAQLMYICLSEDPRRRIQASSLMAMFPETLGERYDHLRRRKPSYSASADDFSVQSFPNHEAYHYVNGSDFTGAIDAPQITTVSPPPDWTPISPINFSHPANLAHLSNGLPYEDGYRPARGRSPPRLPSAGGHPRLVPQYSWKDNNIATGWQESEGSTPRSRKELGPIEPAELTERLTRLEAAISREDDGVFELQEKEDYWEHDRNFVSDEDYKAAVAESVRAALSDSPCLEEPQELSRSNGAPITARAVGESDEAVSEEQIDQNQTPTVHENNCSAVETTANTSKIETNETRGREAVREEETELKPTQNIPEPQGRQEDDRQEDKRVPVTMPTEVQMNVQTEDTMAMEVQHNKPPENAVTLLLGETGTTAPGIKIDTVESHGGVGEYTTESTDRSEPQASIHSTALKAKPSFKEDDVSDARATGGLPSPPAPSSPARLQQQPRSFYGPDGLPAYLNGVGGEEQSIDEKCYGRDGMLAELDNITLGPRAPSSLASVDLTALTTGTVPSSRTSTDEALKPETAAEA